MKIKVCGMKVPENMRDLAKLPVDMMGLIFYEKSPRCVDKQDADRINALSPKISKVGVFVDAPQNDVLDNVERFQLQFVQLHGQESPNFCYTLKNKCINVIKSFNISNEDDIDSVGKYADACDYFLFDAPTPQYGGSGRKFDWNILQHYHAGKPFFLSGGIAPEDFERIRSFQHPSLYAIDLNSRFEIAPGVKDVAKLKIFIQSIYSK